MALRLLGEALMRVVDALLSIPSLVFALLIIVGPGSGQVQATLALGFAAAPRFVRVFRGAALDAAGQDYVAAARARGERARWIQYREMLPSDFAQPGPNGRQSGFIRSIALDVARVGLEPRTCGFGIRRSQSAKASARPRGSSIPRT